MTASFVPIDSGRMSAQIIRQIQEAIDSGRLQTGDRLPPERELAEQFSVSRVTVRDALRALEALGLVDIRVGAAGGAFITVPHTDVVGQGLRNLLTMSSVSSREIAEARLAVELTTVALVVSRRTDDDLTALERLCDEQEADLAAGRTSETTAPKFHLLLAAATKNAAMRLMTESFRGPLSMTAIRSAPPTLESSRLTLEQHRELVEAIRQRDAVEAQCLMAVHLMRRILEPGEARALADEMRGSSLRG